MTTPLAFSHSLLVLRAGKRKAGLLCTNDTEKLEMNIGAVWKITQPVLLRWSKPLARVVATLNDFTTLARGFDAGSGYADAR